jgi:UDP-N-acetylmuramate dehydrogenase
MQIQTNVPLKDYSTMRLGGTAEALTTVTSKSELTEAVAWAEDHRKSHLVLGGGSNIIFSNGYPGLVIVNGIRGFDVLHDDDDSTTVRIGAGEPWDDVVARTVNMNLSGIEKLSAIPGTAGATPVQNVGAYGGEIADTLVEVGVYNTEVHQFATMSKADCKFGYRTSIFKSPVDRHYIITSIVLKLAKSNPQPPFYASLQSYLDKHNITQYTPQTIRQAVLAIRAQKLPDPRIIANTGSFFKNPIVDRDVLSHIQQPQPDVPFYDMPGGKVKLLAGWLIDRAGLRGYSSHGMKVYEQNALVFVNESAQTYADLAAFKQEVIRKVEDAFCIRLEQEPELI